MDKHDQNKDFFNNIQNAIPKHCSNCGNKYTPKDLSLVKKDNISAVFHLNCPKCQESYLINIVSPSGILQGSSRFPIKVDISSSTEAKKFIGKTFISNNDVLDIYDSLKTIKTGKELINLLEKKRKITSI